MITKQNSDGFRRKEGRITHSEKASATKQVSTVLKELKERNDEVIQISISGRTTIELPASLTQEERDERVANYIRLHKSKI